MRAFLPLLAFCASMGVGAQATLALRHARIDTAYKAEQYAEVTRLIDLQLKEAPGTPWEDSLHLYVYKYGRAVRKLKRPCRRGGRRTGCRIGEATRRSPT